MKAADAGAPAIKHSRNCFPCLSAGFGNKSPPCRRWLPQAPLQSPRSPRAFEVDAKICCPGGAAAAAPVERCCRPLQPCWGSGHPLSFTFPGSWPGAGLFPGVWGCFQVSGAAGSAWCLCSTKLSRSTGAQTGSGVPRARAGAVGWEHPGMPASLGFLKSKQQNSHPTQPVPVLVSCPLLLKDGRAILSCGSTVTG